MIKATVAGLDRTTHTARCVTDDGGIIDAAWLGAPPPPTATVLLTEVGRSWVVTGTVGDVRRVLTDDFTAVHTHASGAVGDTVWSLKELNVANVTSAADDPPVGVVGAVRLQADYSAGVSYARIRKRDHHVRASADFALWMHARVAVDAAFLANSGLLEFGFGTSDYVDNRTITEEAAAAVISATAIQALSQRSSGQAVTDHSWTATAGTYYDVDLVVVGGGFVAVWLDGDLVGALTQWDAGTLGGAGGIADIPSDTDDAMTIFALCRNGTAATPMIAADIDLITVDVLSPAPENITRLDA